MRLGVPIFGFEKSAYFRGLSDQPGEERKDGLASVYYHDYSIIDLSNVSNLVFADYIAPFIINASRKPKRFTEFSTD